MFSKNKAQSVRKKMFTEKKIKLELGLIFSDILKNHNKKSKRQLNMVRMNMLRQLEGKSAVMFKTKRIFNEFSSFLDKFEK